MKKLGEILIEMGFSPAELDEAVDQSRAAVRTVRKWSGLGSRGLAHMAKKAPQGSRRNVFAALGSAVLEDVEKKADKLLGGKK